MSGVPVDEWAQRVAEASVRQARQARDWSKVKYQQTKNWMKHLWHQLQDALPKTPKPGGDSGKERRQSLADSHDGDDIAVYDSNGNELLQTKQVHEALEAWRRAGHKGSVVDRTTGENLTPSGWQAFRMSDDERTELAAEIEKVLPNGALSRMSATNPGAALPLLVNADEVNRRVKWLNARRFDPLDIVNLRNSRRTQTLTITKHHSETDMVTVKVPKHHREVTTHENFVPTLDVGDDVEYVSIDPARELLEAGVNELMMPREILGKRLVNDELRKPQQLERVVSEEVRNWTTEEEIKVPQVRDVSETVKVEVPADPHDQLLYILIDWSLSMRGGRIHMALAAASTVIGCHLHDDSRYLYAAFTAEVGETQYGEGEAGKQALLKHILDGRERFHLLSGTAIDTALLQAASEIRAVARGDDRPEILLITDGEQVLTYDAIRDILGVDVTLHTVSIEVPNSSLQMASDTYTLLPAYI